MVQEALPTNLAPAPDIRQLVIEDDTPVDNFRLAKQQRLLTEVLYSFWLIPTGMATPHKLYRTRTKCRTTSRPIKGFGN